MFFYSFVDFIRYFFCFVLFSNIGFDFSFNLFVDFSVECSMGFVVVW